MPEEAEEPEQGEAHRCKLPLDRATQQENQSQALHTSNIFTRWVHIRKKHILSYIVGSVADLDILGWIRIRIRGR